MKKKFYSICILLFLAIGWLNAQTDLSQLRRSNYEGRHFFLGFMQNETSIDPNGLYLKAYISSNSNANIEVKLPNQLTQFYVLKADSVLALTFPEDIENFVSESPQSKSVEINSDVPISVYAFSSQRQTTDAFAAIPVSHWGTEYVCLSFTNDQYQIPMGPPYVSEEDSANLAEPRQSEFLVLAAYDSTVIEFQPSCVTEKAKQVFRTYTVVLNQGESYLVKSLKAPKGTSDLSGTIVRGNKPFGFLSGHVRTAIPFTLSNLWDSKNHLCEMLMPTEAWGRHFVTIPLGANTKGDMIRVSAIKGLTTVTYQNATGGVQQMVLNNPGSVGTIMYLNEPTVWISDKPIQICQYMCHNGSSADNPYYDPSMVTVPPTEQFVTKILFQCPGDIIKNPNVYNYNEPQFRLHRVALIADTASLSSLVIDNKSVNNQYFIQGNKIGGTPYCYGYIDLKPGKHEFSSDQGAFSGVFYGTGDRDAYSMTLGASLTNPYKLDTIPPEIDITEHCGKITGYVQEVLDSNTSGIDYALVDQKLTTNYKWFINKISDTATFVKFIAEPIDVTKDGVFVIDIRDKNGNGKRYRFDYNGIKIAAPSNILFDRVNADDSLCISFYIKNYGKDSVPMSEPSFTNGDPRLSFEIDKTFPRLLNSGDSIKCTICFKPQGDTSYFYAEMIFGFDCDRNYKIPITCTVRFVALHADDYDFGKERVGDIICAKTYIKNTGNSDIRIDSISFPQPSRPFYPDTARLFPKMLKPGESMPVTICFSPDSVQYYELNCIAYNGLTYGMQSSKTAPFKLKGYGIAPNFESIVLDWGRRRLGTKSDTIIYVVNSGTDTSTITMSKLDCAVDVFNTSSNLNFSKWVNSRDSFDLKFGFEPSALIPFSAKAEYSVNWKYHKTVTIELKGEGSIPDIKTIDVDMGIGMMGRKKDSLASIISSNGNERLTIDSVKYFSGDTGAFSYDENLLRNIFIEPGNVQKALISFTPDHLGPYETILEVTHDAMPAFQRAKAYIKITGFAITPDTLDALLKIEAENEIVSCQTRRLTARLTNKGNISLKLQKLDLSAVGLTANWAQPNNLPVVFKPGETLSFPIDIFTKLKSIGTVTVVATMNDTLVKSTFTAVEPIAYPVIIDDLQPIKASPGDSVWLEIKGKFPTRTEVPVDFKIILQVPQKNLLLTAKNSYLTVLENNTTNKYSLTIYPESDKLTLQTDQKIPVGSDNTEWSLKLPFWVMLNEDLHPPIKIQVFPDDCFLSSEKDGVIDIKEVCVFSMRNIKLITNELTVAISPNPAKNFINLDINMPNDDNLSLKIFDKVGKNCYNYENLFLKKGNHSLIFEFCNLTEGVYFLNAQSSDEIKRIKFIISK